MCYELVILVFCVVYFACKVSWICINVLNKRRDGKMSNYNNYRSKLILNMVNNSKNSSDSGQVCDQDATSDSTLCLQLSQCQEPYIETPVYMDLDFTIESEAATYECPDTKKLSDHVQGYDQDATHNSNLYLQLGQCQDPDIETPVMDLDVITTASKQIDVDSVDPETKSSNRGNNTPADSFVDPEQILSDSDPFAQSDCSDRDPCYIPESEISHYSDSELEIIQREPEYLINSTQDLPEVKNSNSETVENINIQENNTLTRKRRCEPQTWKRNKNKKLRLEGKEHTSQSGKKVRAKAVKEVPCKCHYKCNDTFTLNDRQNIFNDFL